MIENFKVGGLKKYGLDHEALSALNPRLITCSVTGFGQDGPYAPRAGYDFMVQGLGGIMSLTGEPEGEPVKTAVAFADVFTGVYGTVAILAALQGRHATGKGCHIDMALLDTQVSVLGNQALVYLVSGMLPPRMGNEHTSIVPTRSSRRPTATSSSPAATTASSRSSAACSAPPGTSTRTIPPIRAG